MTNKQKPRCNFYGCTIPAGVAHHHPLNGPVMRDPSAPLDDAERAELERFRLRERDSAYRQAVGMQNSIGTAGWAKLQNASPLLDRSTTIRGESTMQGERIFVDGAEITILPDVRWSPRFEGNSVQDSVKRLSFPKLVGKMATRFALGIGLVLLAVYFICAIAGLGIMMVEWATGTQVKL